MRPLADEISTAHAVVDSRVQFRSGRVIEVRTDDVGMSDGGIAKRDVVVHPGAVGIIAMDDRNRVLLLEQYRHPVGRRLWEPPAGLLDAPGEDPLVTAKRELYEEAHLQADRWDVLLDIFTSPGMTDEAVRLYLARKVSESTEPQYAAADEELDITTEWVPLDEAVDAAFDGRIHNPLAVAGVLAAAAAARSGFRQLRPADAPWPERSEFSGSAPPDVEAS